MNMSLVQDIANQSGCGEYGHSSQKGCSEEAAKCRGHKLFSVGRVAKACKVADSCPSQVE